MEEFKEYSFEKLAVWTEIRVLIKNVYSISGNFPESEKFGLKNQICRASVSVGSNLAEGSSRTSAKDQAHFYQISYSSLMELLSQLIVSLDLEFVSDENYKNLRLQIQKISMKLNSLRNNALKRSRT